MRNGVKQSAVNRNAGLVAVVLVALAGLGLAACAETDVVARVAASSFEAMVRQPAIQVGYAADSQAWELVSPAGDRFYMALDFGRPAGQAWDFRLDLAAAPFVAAGLNLAKLPAADGQDWQLAGERLLLSFGWGPGPLLAATDGSAAPTAGTAPVEGLVATFKQVLATWRDRIGYHEKLDHYGIALGGGNMLEWAKDLATNDKDLVLVLEPAPLIQAGLDPTRVEGWVFAKVEVKDSSGKAVQVDKLLRPFSL